jgi:hypothetical protein
MNKTDTFKGQVFSTDVFLYKTLIDSLEAIVMKTWL